MQAMSASAMAQHNFAQIPGANIQRSVFNRSCSHKTTFNAGLLIPIFCDEVLPGDTFDMKVGMFGRLPTLIRPIMDNMYADVFFFYVPNRLLWSNWKKFMGEQANPGDSITYLVPQVIQPSGGWTELSLGDYFGVPTKIAGTTFACNALPFRAYNLIWNEWFRDENLQNSVGVALGDGPDLSTSYSVLRRGKRHDYFTSCLPFAQKFAPVSLPLGTTAPVKTLSTEHTTAASGMPVSKWRRLDTGGAPNLVGMGFGTNAGELTISGAFPAGTTGIYPSNLYADLATATAATINQIREAFQVQRLLERDARGGTRYTEIVKSHFGVTSPDARLQRPEFLGGGSVKVDINMVASTSDSTTPANLVGDLAAYGTFGSGSIQWRQSFTEHGYVIGLVSLRADLNYQQGLERHWSRRTRYDYYWPAFANLGEQAVLNKEIYAQGTSADDLVFGYQERHAEYRFKPSIVTGRMRSNAATPLDSWHLSQRFLTLPALNAAFIEENPPVDRIVAVAGGTEPHAVADFDFRYRCARPMPMYAVPGLIDHF